MLYLENLGMSLLIAASHLDVKVIKKFVLLCGIVQGIPSIINVKKSR
jgi:hypothetical protein